MRGGWPCNLLKSAAALLVFRVFRTAAQNQVTFDRRYGKWEFEYAVPYRYPQHEILTFFPIADPLVLGIEKHPTLGFRSFSVKFCVAQAVGTEKLLDFEQFQLVSLHERLYFLFLLGMLLDLMFVLLNPIIHVTLILCGEIFWINIALHKVEMRHKFQAEVVAPHVQPLRPLGVES